jgi:hypothetical protein
MTGPIQVRNDELVSMLGADFINCWIPLQQVVLESEEDAIAFEDIAQEFRTLVIQIQARTDYAAEFDYVDMRFNEDSGANYDWMQARIQCDGGTTRVCARGATFAEIAHVEGTNSTANVFTTANIWLIGYALTDRYKEAFSGIHGRWGDLQDNLDIRMTLARGLWHNTEPISHIALFPENGSNFEALSRFALYGIL